MCYILLHCKWYYAMHCCAHSNQHHTHSFEKHFNLIKIYMSFSRVSELHLTPKRYVSYIFISKIIPIGHNDRKVSLQSVTVLRVHSQETDLCLKRVQSSIILILILLFASHKQNPEFSLRFQPGIHSNNNIIFETQFDIIKRRNFHKCSNTYKMVTSKSQTKPNQI